MVTRIARPLGLLALAAGAVLALPVSAPAGETRGPEFGNNRYVTSIRHLPGELDTDDYVTPLARGERFSVCVTPTRGSPLAPTIEVLGPDGHRRSAPVVGKKRKWEVRNFTADATGEWTVRVGGSGTTAGEYSVSFATQGAAPFQLRRLALIGSPPTATVPIEAVEGTLADLRVTWRSGTGVAVASLLDPSGDDLLARPENSGRVRTRPSSAELRGFELRGGHGTYLLGLTSPGADPREFDVTVRLRPPKRIAGKQAARLAVEEPCLEIRSEPILGVAGRTVRLRGSILVPGVRVFFGDAEATSVVCFFGDQEIDVVPPAGVPGSTVAVAAVLPDGQACVRPGYFRYAPVPRVLAVTGGSGEPAPGWSTAGGRVLRIAGTDFRSSMRVVFPGGVEAVPSSVSETEIVVTSPAGGPGSDYLAVVDEFGQRGRSPVLFEMKSPPVFAASPYSPVVAPVGTSVPVTVTGSKFEVSDVLLLDGAAVASTMQGATTRRFTLPASAKGFRSIALRDRLGVVTEGPAYQVKPAGTVTAVTVESGAVLQGNGIPAEGGPTIRVDGSDFAPTDAVTLGGLAVTKLSGATSTSFRFVAPALPFGDADLGIVDVLSQTTTAAAVVRTVGFGDATPLRLPAADATDDFRAASAVLGDLDGDGSEDVVLAAPAGTWIGWRSELTRILLNDGSGTLADATGSHFPSAGTDATGADDWNAEDLALGDLDGDGDLDLVVAGASPDPWTTGDVRLFANDGTGGFSLDEGSAPPTSAHGTIYAYDEWGWAYAVVGPRDPRGTATCVALGDLDGDGDDDLVVGRSDVESELEIVDADYVDFNQDPPFVSYQDVWYHTVNRTRFVAGTRILRNGLSDGAGFEDVTADALPSVGTSQDTSLPALAARDAALSDLDGDGDLDLVLAWDDPRTVSVEGLTQGAGTDTERVATRVLRNDGGTFTDVTSGWMPAGGSSEWWQAERIAIADLDQDGDGDLLLLCARGLDAWQGGAGGKSSALRILRNDGGRFTNVTASVLPALRTGDDLRGHAVGIRDVDGDGTQDLLLSTAAALSGGGKDLRSTRLLLNSPSFRFTDASMFLPAAASDSGQAEATLLGDLGGDGGLSLLLFGTDAPKSSGDGALLRAFDWTW